ncbi:MAG: hypothetical protein LBQ86_03140 [Holophagales bacterium]|nr:hypothetical protein [Holophagales bacterium]
MKYLILFSVLFFHVSLVAQGNSTRQGATAQTGDQETGDQAIVDFARKLLEKTRASDQELRAGLKTIQDYVFKNRNAPEREYVLYAQGMLEDKTNQLSKAVVTFRRFERVWPNSKYMPEANLVLGKHALNQAAERRNQKDKLYKEAETRFQNVLDSDLPVESKFTAQGFLIWMLVDQKRREEAHALVKTLFPIGRSKPDEKVLLAIMELQCEAKDIEGAKKTRASYLTAYRNSAMKTRVNLSWGLLIGEAGQSAEAARALRSVINDAPRSELADEARLALATLLLDGKLPDKANPNKDTPQALLAQLRTAGVGGDAPRRALLLQTRMASEAKQWNNVMALTSEYRQKFPDSPDLETIISYRHNAIRSMIQDTIDNGGGLLASLSLLNAENISVLTPQLRSDLISACVASGLPEAAVKIIQASPATEQDELRQLLTRNIPEPLPPPLVITSISGSLKGFKGELGQIQLLLSQKKWNEASLKIENLSPGPDRIKAVLALLLRPMPPNEIHLRRKEAEGWLANTSETTPVNDPLLIFIADLYMQTDNQEEALALYPTNPQPENQGWVSLMRATALSKLGKTEEAKLILDQNASVPEFKQYRQLLSNKLSGK